MDPFSAFGTPRPRAARKAEFARFHDDNYPTLVALLHALRGNRGHAHRASQRAFTHAWLQWENVRSLPDPVGWTRRRARQVSPPRRRLPPEATESDSEWVAPAARPIFHALGELPEELRVLLALRYIAGLDYAQIAEEEQLPLNVIVNRLAEGREIIARRIGAFTTSDDATSPDPQAIHLWVERGLADLAHALSYRTDHRALEQVFRQALRYRAKVVAATAAVVSLGGIGGALAISQNLAPPALMPPPVNRPGTALTPAPQPEGARGTPPTVPAAPPAPGAPPAPPVQPSESSKRQSTSQRSHQQMRGTTSEATSAPENRSTADSPTTHSAHRHTTRPNAWTKRADDADHSHQSSASKSARSSHHGTRQTTTSSSRDTRSTEAKPSWKTRKASSATDRGQRRQRGHSETKWRSRSESHGEKGRSRYRSGTSRSSASGKSHSSWARASGKKSTRSGHSKSRYRASGGHAKKQAKGSGRYSKGRAHSGGHRSKGRAHGGGGHH